MFLLGFLGLLVLGAAFVIAFYLVDFSDGLGLPFGIFVGLLIAAIGALWAGSLVVGHHFDDLERLRALLLVAAARAERLPADWPALGEAGREALDLADAACRALDAQRERGERTDDKLAAVVAAAAEGLLVMTDTGLVSLVNEAALDILGADAVAVGTSVYAALERDHMVDVEQRAQRTGEAVQAELLLVDGRRMEALVAPLGDHGGYVISLPHREPGRRNLVRHDLSLHDAPPQARVPSGASPRDWRLEDLPVVVFDSETTGLDVSNARIVSLGAVRCHGHRAYPRVNLDRLVDPGVPIPAQSFAIHGIADEMVAGAGSFSDSWPVLSAMFDGMLVVGHSIGFDLAILKAECGRYGLHWKLPPALDTGLLYSALYPRETDVGLESLAARFGVEIEGRHTALGDALVTAEIWIALMAQLIDRGIATYGAARRFSLTARPLLARQRQAGWVLAADSGQWGQADG